MLKREKPNKISRSPSRLCCFSGLSKKKKKQSVGRSASLFDFRFIKKRKEKKQREQVKVIFKYIALVLQSQYGSDSLSPWLYLFQLNNIKIILKNHQVKYMNFIWSSYYWIISGLSFHCYTSLEMQPKNFLNSSYGDKNEFKQERIKLSLGWSSGWKNILSPTAKKIDKARWLISRTREISMSNSVFTASDQKKKQPL